MSTKTPQFRSEWNASTCREKLSVDLWAYMTAEGTANSSVQSDALFVRANCSIQLSDIKVLELITPQVCLDDFSFTKVYVHRP